VRDLGTVGKRADRARTGSGAFVVMVGPDGVGKTTVARELIAAYEGSARYFHFRPAVFSELSTEPPLHQAAPPDKGPSGGSRVLGWIRLLRSYAYFWLGHLARVRPAVRRGELVVGDRWAYGYLVQPRAMKYFGPRWLAEWAIRALPRPDLVANLRAPAAVVHTRKQELTLGEIDTELDHWLRLPVRDLASFTNLDDPAQAARQILVALSR
jgi:hypothetical protein